MEITSANQTGSSQVTVSVTDQFETTSTSFDVTVTNEAPELDLNDVTLAAGESVEIALPTLDADGQAVSYEVEVIDPSLPSLDIEFEDRGSFYDNYLGNNERWLRSVQGQWYFLLEDGNLYRWDGSIENSELIAELGTDYYENANLLLEPPAPAVTATVENGILTLTASASFTGSVQLRIQATDGINTVEQTIVIQSAAFALASASTDDVFADWDYLN